MEKLKQQKTAVKQEKKKVSLNIRKLAKIETTGLRNSG